LDDVEKSLSPINDENIKSIFKAGEGMGKSGSFFFFSHDTNFLIKTMTMDDFNAFMYVFKYYFEHIN
jgi:1-phosphatidylinositol-4-phosphate 5-kinase